VKYFKVTFKDGKSVTIEKPDDATEDVLRALWKDGKNLELNEVVYRTEQIASLTEVKPRTPRAAS
jgi:2-hydroxychromene-2-carboxylate isomerase